MITKTDWYYIFGELLIVSVISLSILRHICIPPIPYTACWKMLCMFNAIEFVFSISFIRSMNKTKLKEVMRKLDRGGKN